MGNMTVVNRDHVTWFLDWLIAFVALALIAAYTYGYFFQAAYWGFTFDTTGRIVRINSLTQPGGALHVGDQISKIGTVSWDAYRSGTRVSFEAGLPPGTPVLITVMRAGQLIDVPSTIPDFTWQQVEARLISQWSLPWALWLAGVMSLLFIRPRDLLRSLFAVLCFLTATWVAAGVLSAWRLWESAVVLRAAIWLSVPVYLLVHWLFPTPLGRVPHIVVMGSLIAGVVLTTAEWWQLMPTLAYFFGFLLATAGSIALLGAHYVRQPAQRHSLRLVLAGAAIALVPSVELSLAGLQGELSLLSVTTPLALPILPLTYMLVFARSVKGGQLRANRAVVAYIFISLVMVGSVIVIGLAARWLQADNVAVVIGLLATCLALAAGMGWPAFERFVAQRLMHISVPPAQLLTTYAGQLVLSADQSTLVSILRERILPSLMIRQSALLRLDDGDQPEVVLAEGVMAQQIPNAVTLMERGLMSRPPTMEQGIFDAPFLKGWIRLALPLRIDSVLVGVWLFGQRDPVDAYSATDIEHLRALADQTALALAYLTQTQRLRELNQANLQRQENERAQLALELHDDILNELGLATGQPLSAERKQHVINRIRQIVAGLRPVMLNYGLLSAFEQLGDDLAERSGPHVRVEVVAEADAVRYPALVEQHVFRIVQQAAENTLKHAQANTLSIAGMLGKDLIELAVSDDGVGLPRTASSDLAALLRQRHYGLAGMHERAASIGAQLRFDSDIGQGTQVTLSWTSQPDRS